MLERVAFGPSTGANASSTTLSVTFSAAALLLNTTFSEDGPQDDIESLGGSVYADTPNAYQLLGGSPPVQSLSAVPQNLTFLAADDPELQLIQEVRVLPGIVRTYVYVVHQALFVFVVSYMSGADFTQPLACRLHAFAARHATARAYVWPCRRPCRGAAQCQLQWQLPQQPLHPLPT